MSIYLGKFKLRGINIFILEKNKYQERVYKQYPLSYIGGGSLYGMVYSRTYGRRNDRSFRYVSFADSGR